MLKKLKIIHDEAWLDLRTPNGDLVLTVCEMDGPNKRYIMRRLTAAWNATRDVDLEDLEKHGVLASPEVRDILDAVLKMTLENILIDAELAQAEAANSVLCHRLLK